MYFKCISLYCNCLCAEFGTKRLIRPLNQCICRWTQHTLAFWTYLHVQIIPDLPRYVYISTDTNSLLCSNIDLHMWDKLMILLSLINSFNFTHRYVIKNIYYKDLTVEFMSKIKLAVKILYNKISRNVSTLVIYLV